MEEVFPENLCKQNHTGLYTKVLDSGLLYLSEINFFGVSCNG